ncbi:MAG TPA: hypothetical protein VFH75_04355 [Actinomycetota bacterium]|nr:hypothetical protein [Actinomycetota bacterium]
MSRDPVPEEPIEGIIRAFETAPLVALGEAHGVGEQADLIGELLGSPSFSDLVDTVVVEFGNALFQPEIDRYVAGEDVDRDDLQRVWREVIGGIHSRVFESPIYERFFTMVREYNRGRSPGRGLRVLLGDPPYDRAKSSDERLWSLIEQRDEHFAEVVEREVLARGRRALLIAGAGHFSRLSDLPPPRRNVVQIIEEHRPGSTVVIVPHFLFPDVREARSRDCALLEARLSAWPVPSLAFLAGTWLGDVDASLLFGETARRFEPDGRVTVVDAPFLSPDGQPVAGVTLADIADAYLYLGPTDTLSLVDPQAPDPQGAAIAFIQPAPQEGSA